MKLLLCAGLLSLLITLQHSNAFNIGSDFAQMLLDHVENKFPFVDKTMFIRDFILSPLKYMIVTRPRKWGKSLNMNMLHQFLSIEVDNKGERIVDDLKIYKRVFREGALQVNGSDEKYPRLKIADHPSLIEKYQGKWPVLKLDFSKFRICPYFRDDDWATLTDFCRFIKKLFDYDYPYLLEKRGSLGLEESERIIIRNFSAGIYHTTITTANFEHFFYILVKAFYNYFDKLPIYVLIDGYDSFVNHVFFEQRPSPYACNYTLELFETIFAVLQHPDLQPKIKKVLLTGTLPHLQTRGSGRLSTYHLITVTDTSFSEYYGFTKTEVETLVKVTPELGNREAVLNNITNWYDGYRSGGNNIFNPWSVRACLFEKGKIDTYWKFAEKFPDIYTEKAITNEKLRHVMELMMSKNETASFPPIRKPFGYWDLNDTKASFPLLLHKGLLTANKVFINGKSVLRYSIPNREARSIIYQEIMHHEMEELGVVNENLPLGPGNPVMYIARGKIGLFENSTQILLDSYCKASSIKSVEPFHWLMEALIFPALYERYHLVSERDFDLGETFWRIVPMSQTDCAHLPIVILGYRYTSHENDMVSTCKKVINRIISKNYIGDIQVGNRSVYYVGAAVTYHMHFKAMYACPLKNGTLFIEANVNEEGTYGGENKA